MQLQEKYSEQVVAISLNADFNQEGGKPSEDLQKQVRDKLTELGIACTNVIATDPYDQVISDFEVFSLPAVIVFDREGKVHKRFDGSVDYEKEVGPLVAQLLQQSPS